MLSVGLAVLMVGSLLALLPARPAGANGTLDDARVLLSVCPQNDCAGVRVYMTSASNQFGPGGYSFCTANETSTDFQPSGPTVARTLSMVVKNEGSCYARNSYNVWIVAAYQNGKLLGRTLVWVGQDIALGYSSYYTNCHGNGPWPASDPHLQCARDSGYNANRFLVRVSLPAPPSPPACPSAGTSCYLHVHLDSPLCVSFKQATQTCKGSSDGTSGWAQRFGVTQFSWTTDKVGHKVVTYQVIGALNQPSAQIQGVVPNEGSGSLVTTEAYSTAGQFPASRWYSQTSGPPGKEGGPLHIDFAAGQIGADIYIDGWLQRK